MGVGWEDRCSLSPVLPWIHTKHLSSATEARALHGSQQGGVPPCLLPVSWSWSILLASLPHPPSHLEICGCPAPTGLKEKLNTVYCSREQQDRPCVFRQDGESQHLPLGKKHSRRAGFYSLGLEEHGVWDNFSNYPKKAGFNQGETQWSHTEHFPTIPVRFRDPQLCHKSRM